MYKPTPFVAPSPDSEIIGQILAGWFLRDAYYQDIEPILKKHGVDTIEPNKWYSMQKVLDIYADIFGRKENVSIDIVAMGMNTTEVVLPPEITEIEQAIRFTNEVVHRSCKKVPPDFGFLLTIVGPNHLLVKNNVPFAPQGLYGYLWRVVTKLKHDDDIFIIKPLPEVEGDPVTLEIKWGPDEEALA